MQIMMSNAKKKLVDLIKNDSSIFDFIKEWALDGLYYKETINLENEWINPKLWTNLGYDSSEIYNETFISKKLIESTRLKDSLEKETIELKHKNGTKIAMHCKTLAIVNSEGKTIANLCCFIKSKSEVNVKKYIRKLKKQEEFLEKSNEASLIGYWEVNLKKQKLYWSKMTKIIHETPLDYEPDTKNAINFYLEGEYRDQIDIAFNRCISEGIPFNLELQIITLKQNIKWVRAIGQAVFIKGVCTRVYGTFQDTTQVKVANIALTQEKEKLQSLIQSTNSGTWQWNIQTGETQHNEIWANIIGYKLKEITPITTEKWVALIHPDDLKRSNIRMEACFEKKEDYYESEYRIKHKDGHWIWVLDKGKIISWTDDGKPLMMFGIHTDISEQKKVVLRNMLFIENTPTAIAMFDANMNYLAASKKWKFNNKLEDKIIFGVSHYELCPENETRWKEIHQMGLRGDSQKNADEKFIKEDGSTQWIKWEVNPWFNDSGTLGGLIVYTHDITARKKTQEQLRISEEAFRGNFESAAIGMAFLDKNGGWLKVNARICEMLGYTEAELTQKTFRDITHPDDHEADIKILKELVQGKRSYYHIEKRYFSKDNQIVHIILGVSIVRGDNNQILYFIAQIIDITAQKKAEKKLEESNAKIQSLFEASTHVSMIETDINGIITTFNKGAENLLGYTKEEMLYKQTPSILHLEKELEERAQEIFEKHNAIVKGFDILTYTANNREYETLECTYVKKDGSTLPVQLTMTAVIQDSQISGYLGIAVDISYIKKTEKEIQSLLHVTKDQNERLKNFAHIVSHNLYSHSGNIAMMLDLLEYEYPDLKQNEYIELLNTASMNLKETIGHLNEVVLMNTTITENLLHLNLYQYMAKTIISVTALAINGGVQIENLIDPLINIQAIPAYLESILLNFVTNGIKYKSNERSSFIKIHCTVEEQYVVLHIEDNGIGIDMKKNRDKLFGMYKTFHNNKDARGIGLFITKNQIEAMNGKVEVSSELNVGTTFKIYFQNEKN